MHVGVCKVCKDLCACNTNEYGVHTYIGRHSLHVDWVFESLVVCSPDPQLVGSVVFDRFWDRWEGLAELPNHVPEVITHVNLDVNVG